MVPSLLIGSALGRLFGLIVTDVAGGVHHGTDNDWIDPGVFALIGAAAFFAGLTRLTMSLTVIMIELTNETHFLLPLMTAGALWVGG
jgi:chloride channel 7